METKNIKKDEKTNNAVSSAPVSNTEQKSAELDLSQFQRERKTKTGTDDPGTYIHYKLKSDPEAYNIIMGLRARSVNVDKLAIALIKKFLTEQKEKQEAAKTEQKENQEAAKTEQKAG